MPKLLVQSPMPSLVPVSRKAAANDDMATQRFSRSAHESDSWICVFVMG